MRARFGWAATAGLLLAGCGGNGIDRHVEPLVTIDQGIYGQATSVNDVGDPDVQVLWGFEVDAFAVPSSGTELAATEGSATTASMGFYEIALPAGEHVVCTASRRCVTATVPQGGLVRLDCELSVGPGWQGGTPWPPGNP